MNKLQKLARLQRATRGILRVKSAALSEAELKRLKALAAGKNPGYLTSIARGALLGAGLGGGTGAVGGLLGASTINSMAKSDADEHGITPNDDDASLSGLLGRAGQRANLGNHGRMAAVGSLTGVGLGALGGGLHGLYNHFINKSRLQELAKLQLAAAIDEE